MDVAAGTRPDQPPSNVGLAIARAGSAATAWAGGRRAARMPRPFPRVAPTRPLARDCAIPSGKTRLPDGDFPSSIRHSSGIMFLTTPCSPAPTSCASGTGFVQVCIFGAPVSNSLYAHLTEHSISEQNLPLRRSSDIASLHTASGTEHRSHISFRRRAIFHQITVSWPDFRCAISRFHGNRVD